MELKLQSDGATGHDSESVSETGSQNMRLNTNEEDYSNSGGGYYGDEDDFSDLEEDTVFIANRYQNTTSNAASNTTSSYQSSARIIEPDRTGYIIFFLSVGLTIAGLIVMGLSVSSSALTSSAGVMAMAGSLSVGNLMITGGTVLLLVDAIRLKVKGYSTSLIVWAILFPPIYWFKRCSENGDSSVIAWVILLAFGLSAGFYFKQAFNMVQGGSYQNSNPQQTTYTYVDQNGNVIYYETSNSATEATVNPDEVIANVQRVYYNVDGHKYTVGQIIKDNVQNPEYTYVPADGRYQTVSYIEVTGRTTLYGKDQKIVFDYYSDNYRVRQVKIGSKTYKSDKDINQILDDMIAHTTPDVQW